MSQVQHIAGVIEKFLVLEVIHPAARIGSGEGGVPFTQSVKRHLAVHVQDHEIA